MRILRHFICLAITLLLLSINQQGYAQLRRGSAGSLLMRGTGTLTLQNGEQITNDTDGKVCIEGQGGTNDEDLCIDLESTADAAQITSTTGAHLIVSEDIWLGSASVSTNFMNFRTSNTYPEGGIILSETSDASSDFNGIRLNYYADDNAFRIMSKATGVNAKTQIEIPRDTYGVSFFGYITAASAEKYILWQVNDTDDWFNLTREDTNIQGFKVNMPLNIATTGTQPTCDSSQRGTLWFTQSAAGVKDGLEVCAKDASDVYGWRTLY